MEIQLREAQKERKNNIIKKFLGTNSCCMMFERRKQK